MHLGRCSFFFLITVTATLKSTIAITGCIVTLLNTNSIRRKVLCADPKAPIEFIPEGLPQYTDMLIVSNQNITTITEDDFATVYEMKALHLTSSNLRRVHKNAFKPLINLIDLDLSGNKLTISIQSFPGEIFVTLPKLQYLKLSGNPIELIPDFLFKPISTNLRKLFLNKCGNPSLTIAPKAFNGVLNMEELDLRESGIVTLPVTLEDDLNKMKSLKKLLIGGNNFICNCKFRWFYFYLIQIQDSVIISQDEDKDIRCAGPPQFLNKRFPSKDAINQLGSLDFKCSPKCSVVEPREIIADAGSSVNLTCDCFSDPIQPLIWTKNGHIVEEMTNKYKIFRFGSETFQSILNILSLQYVDSGNWSCKIETEGLQNFSLKVKANSTMLFLATWNIYVLVGLGSSLFLVSLVIILLVMFCRRESICNLRNQHPMVICGYETNYRKSSLTDGDLQYRYNPQNGRFNTSFYENTIPFDSSLSSYHRSNHLYPDDLLSEKSFSTKRIELCKGSNDTTMPNGCNYTSDEEPNSDIMRTSSNYLRKTHAIRNFEKYDQNCRRVKQQKTATELETLLPKIKPCPLHDSSGTLTRIPGEKPCPVHGSTSTLPSRLSSKKVEHRFGCPKHNTDNISVKSLKLDDCGDHRLRPHRCKSVSKIPTKFDASLEKLEIQTPIGYKPCPLHGDVLAAINENIFEPISSIKNVHSKCHKAKSLKSPAIGCERINRKSLEILKNRGDLFQLSSVNVSHCLTSPVQSSISSSPLLTSDVHGTLV